LLADITTDVPDVGVADLSLDSRAIRPGTAFIALPGLRTHGAGFAAQAVAAGATTVLWEPTANVAAPKLPAATTVVAIPDLTAQLGRIADRFFDAPSRDVAIAAVTGTNGKTTTAYVIAAALEHLGQSSAYAGTIGTGPVGALEPATHTTPDCISVHRQIATQRDRGIRVMGMEVTSHAIEQHRVDAVRFSTAVFTNLTRDHLDYHGTLEAYGAVKARLFAWPELKTRIVNVDDAFGRELAFGREQASELIVYGRASPVSSLIAHHRSQARSLCASAVRVGAAGLDIDVDGSWGRATLHSRFIGDFNVDNALAVLAVLLTWNVPLVSAVRAVEQCAAPPGRMETFTAPGRALAIVDYAHTPDALEKALAAARLHCTGRLICVFGCGGDRDKGKRPLMGAIAERLADAIVVTDDNPRTENGDAIVADILAGVSAPKRALVERDRARAIGIALADARSGDAVLIAGKGHEDYQIVGSERRHFSDQDVVRRALGGAP
jgi:UDP-N-acetylmuramoyl-L-alanyl-D-glutamate--2,6-diaminopimelate ligase